MIAADRRSHLVRLVEHLTAVEQLAARVGLADPVRIFPLGTVRFIANGMLKDEPAQAPTGEAQP